MDNEVWKSVSGYEGIYEVSNMGRVRSLDRVIVYSNGNRANAKGRIIVPHLCGPKGSQYLAVGLHKQGVQKTTRVHRMVAEAFIPNPDGKEQIDHINMDKTDNRVSNLRWATAKENTNYMIDAGRYNGKPEAMLTKEVRAKLMPKLRKRVMRDDGVVFESITTAAQAIGRTRNAVGMVVNHPTRKCNGHSFTFVD